MRFFIYKNNECIFNCKTLPVLWKEIIRIQKLEDFEKYTIYDCKEGIILNVQ